jgi:adenine-specific DNA-methyltransferase
VTKKQKLELTWIGTESRPRLAPRILLEDPERSYHAQYRVREGRALTAENSGALRSLRSLRLSDSGDLFENRLILGDNLLALKALESQRNEKRRSLFDVQDQVDQQREDLIANIEGKLAQKSGLQHLFTIRWRLA